MKKHVRPVLDESRYLLFALCLMCILPSGCGFNFWPWGDDAPPARSQGARPHTEEPGTLRPAIAQAPVQAQSVGASSGARYPAEAEQAYAQARGLWRRGTTGEICTDPEQAVGLLDKAIGIAPGFGEAYLRRGLAKSELGEFEEAFEDATAGLRLAPSPEAYALRGLVLLRGGQLKAARRDLEYSLSKDSAQHLAYNLMGVLALSENNSGEACASFQAGCSHGDCFFLEAAKTEKLCR